MRSVVIYRWGFPHPGREAEAMRFAADCEAAFKQMVDEGTIDRYEWITSGTGEEHDMMVLWGDGATLAAMMATPAQAQTVALGRYLMRDFRWDLGVAGEKSDEVYGAWAHMLTEHAVI